MPVLLALATVPAYLALIGAERYGVLAIAWVILGYFGLFDLGLGRATAQHIAALHAASPEARATTFWTALSVNAAVGAVGGLLLWPAAYYSFSAYLHISPAIRAEAVAAVPLLCLSVPVATTTGVLIGALQGRERFLETNVISVASTSLFQLLPLGIGLALGPNLTILLLASLAARVVAVAMLWRQCSRHLLQRAGRRFDPSQLRSLLHYGGWVTVTAMFGPLLVVTDRFAIGAFLSAVAVAIYSVPMQITQRLSTVAGAVGNAIFPRIAAEAQSAHRLSEDATRAMVGLLSFPVLVGVLLMHTLLTAWVGHAIADQATTPGMILLIAGWINAFAQMPYVQLQASGRPDLVSKVLLLEIPFYLPGLYYGVRWGGLSGAALVFALRNGVDYVILNLFARGRIAAWPEVALGALLLSGVVLATVLRLRLGNGAYLGIALLAATAIGILSWRTVPVSLRGYARRFLTRRQPQADAGP